MIAIDTSALMAMVLEEPQASACRAALADDPDRVISAVTLAETMVVADRRGLGSQMTRALGLVKAQVEPADIEVANAVRETYTRWGKGVHRAQLNLIDCFAYALAQANACPLLYVGDDFAQTDVASALSAPA